MLYKKRICLENIKKLLDFFPCVSILGARQIGKTTLLKQLLPDANFFDLEKESDLSKIEDDPNFFLSQFKTPIVIDESQMLPSLFRALRVLIDNNRHQKGQFLLSGSSSPLLLKNITESLAGRIALFELQGLSIEEAWEISHSDFFDILINRKNTKDFYDLKPNLSKENLLETIVPGQYPEPFINKSDSKFINLWMENYINAYIKRDIRNLFPHLNLRNYQRFIKMLFYSSGEIINYSNYAKSLGVSVPTIKNYFDIISGTFIFRHLYPYEKNIKKRIIKMPKGHIRDSGLLCYMFNIKTIEDFYMHPKAGFIWESFIIEEILKGLTNRLITYSTYYYRTQHKAEIDLVVEGNFGTIPIEIKLGEKTKKNQIISLINFIEENNLKFGIIINLGKKVEFLTPKIIQIPANFI